MTKVEILAENAKLKDLLEKQQVILRRVFAEQLPDNWFVCGESKVKDENGLPDHIHVCPAYGCDWSVIYERAHNRDIYARAHILELLESLIPYLEYASAKGLPNAQYYLEVIGKLLWRS